MNPTSSLRLLLIGEESAAVQALRVIRSTRPADHIVAVMTSTVDGAHGNTSLASVAAKIGLPVWRARLVKDPLFAETVRAEDVDVILNVHSRYIVVEEVLNAARIGAFNMHPGPLPEYAGLNCVSWALYRGEPRFAVTVHWMAREIDTGDIAYQAAFPIETDDTPLSLTHKCVKAGVPLLGRLLETAANDPASIPRSPQDLSRREYFGKEIPDSGRLSWSRPADEIVNLVRACDYTPFLSPWGLPKAIWKNHEIAIVKADRTHQKCDGAPGVVGLCDKSGAWIASGDEWVSIRQMKIDGEFVNPQSVLTPGSLLRDGL